MMTCITCSKQQIDDEGEGDAVTAQMKDISLKLCGSSKSKPPTNFNKGHKPFTQDLHTINKRLPYYPSYMQTSGISCSTPARDFNTNTNANAGGYEPPRQSGHLVLDSDDDPIDWMAQVEPGVQITFVSLPNGGNDLKRIRFSREMFNKWQAHRWWGENYDRIMELYNVQRFNCQALDTPSRSDDGRDSTYSRLGSINESPMLMNCYKAGGYNAGPKGGEVRTTTSEAPSVSTSNASDIDSEWIEEDEPGVNITIRQLVDGTRDLRRVRFSCEKFGEVHAKMWWEQNRERIQSQYLYS